MLVARDINFRIGSTLLLTDVNVSFAPGKLYLIVGPNGAGKSTLIKILAGLVYSQSGRVTYEGTEIRNIDTGDLAKRRAVLSQAVEIAFPLTVREVVMMGRYPHFGGRPGPLDEKITDEMMGFFDVTGFSERNYLTLSGGERQRVNFARVLSQLWLPKGSPPAPSCRYLFLDEPLTFLDIRHQIQFMEKLRSFGRFSDVVTVGVVHDLNLAARFADEIIMLNQGQVVATGAPTEILTTERLREVFGVESTTLTDGYAGIHLVFGSSAPDSDPDHKG